MEENNKTTYLKYSLRDLIIYDRINLRKVLLKLFK